MSASRFYRQCRLVRPLDAAGGRMQTAEMTSYLPVQFAKVGETVRLRDPEGHWTDGWIVEAISTESIPEEALPDSHADIRGHRRNTGDATSRR